jgi:hypothetical protein
MGADARRTLLVVSERPHPWVLLRDWLDPELVTVAWLGPGRAAAGVAPWLVAGDGAAAPTGVAGLAAWHWVGPPPRLPVRPVVHEDWRALAADAKRRLAVRLGGLRLAPGAGLVLPDGSYLSRAGVLEVLLAAHPDGLDAAGSDLVRLRAAGRRAQALLERLRVPLRVVREGSRMALQGQPGESGFGTTGQAIER